MPLFPRPALGWGNFLCHNGAVSPFLIVGLGNPGARYENTRHNIGQNALEEIGARCGARFKSHKRTGTAIAETHLGGVKVILAAPLTFMNNSGGPVKNLADFFSLPPHNVVVLYDDVEQDFGKVAVRPPGAGDRGHKGLRDITKALGGQYHRVGLGIGRPPGRMDLSAFVLKPFTAAESTEVPIMCGVAADLVAELITTSGL